MSFDFAALNVWAVLVSAIATFMIGGPRSVDATDRGFSLDGLVEKGSKR